MIRKNKIYFKNYIIEKYGIENYIQYIKKNIKITKMMITKYIEYIEKYGDNILEINYNDNNNIHNINCYYDKKYNEILNILNSNLDIDIFSLDHLENIKRKQKDLFVIKSDLKTKSKNKNSKQRKIRRKRREITIDQIQELNTENLKIYNDYEKEKNQYKIMYKDNELYHNYRIINFEKKDDLIKKFLIKHNNKINYTHFLTYLKNFTCVTNKNIVEYIKNNIIKNIFLESALYMSNQKNIIIKNIKGIEIK